MPYPHSQHQSFWASANGFAIDDTASFADRMHKFMKVTLNLDADAGLVEEEEYSLDEDVDDDDDDAETDDDDAVATAG